MRKFAIMTAIIIFYILSAAESQGSGYKPPEGYVPNAETAIKIAEAVWLPIYGEDIYRKKPFKAALKDSTWIVTGSLPQGLFLGGVPRTEISKDTGCILHVSHGK